jgi:DNA-binding protein H-NS
VNKSYTELMAQIESLQREAEKARQAEVEGVIERMKEAIKAYNLTAEDLGLSSRSEPRTSSPARRKRPGPPKYGDGAGNVWSGRGPRPRWLKEALKKGARLEQFDISQR